MTPITLISMVTNASIALSLEIPHKSVSIDHISTSNHYNVKHATNITMKLTSAWTATTAPMEKYSIQKLTLVNIGLQTWTCWKITILRKEMELSKT